MTGGLLCYCTYPSRWPYSSAASIIAATFSGGTSAWMLCTEATTNPPPVASSSMRCLTSRRTSSGQVQTVERQRLYNKALRELTKPSPDL